MRELELLDALKSILTPHGSLVERSVGDDAAVLADSGAAVVSVDQTVAGVHADPAFFGPSEFGSRAVLAAISDLAAMGVRPAAVLLALVIPEGTGLSEATALIEAADAAAVEHGASIIGGDVTSGPCLMAGVTVIGYPDPGITPIGRDGARTGDLVAVTGSLGGSAAGLQVLRGADGPESLSQRHMRPTPRTAEGMALSRLGVSAMIDLSDGLATDAAHLARSSRASIEIDASRVPLQPGVEQVARQLGSDPREFAMTGGEDFELLICISPALLDAATEAIGGVGLTVIGKVCDGEPRVSISGRSDLAGWEHDL